ncbi:DUF3221 domain-containing protein [Sporosarcina sp. UB5]|uniref:DUF3221 domain-containing protein n=1 Tax=Sporosarcina sp. UB5 TaxID=3047463 RepID=UPI003D7B3009
MKKTFKAFAIIVLLIISGCSNLVNQNDEESSKIETVSSYFTGKIEDINGNTALVYAELGGGKGNVFVDLSVNSDQTFSVGDEIKVGYDGTIMESNPAQINTLSVELVD